MEISEVRITSLSSPGWNPNSMGRETLSQLRESLKRYGVVQPLVVRTIGDDTYEVLSGNQRLEVLEELGRETAPCVVVQLEDSQAQLLAQVLNHLHGEDDLGLRGELLRSVLESLPEEEVLAVLPETAQGLKGLAALGRGDMAEHLGAWQRAQGAKLQHFQAQLTGEQLPVVEEALSLAMRESTTDRGDNPNRRGNALYSLCLAYLESKEQQL